VVVQIDEVMQVDEVTQADDLLGLPDLELFKLTTLLKTSQIFYLKTLRGLKIHKLSTIRQRTMKRRIMTTVGVMIWMTLHGTLKKLTVTTNKLKTKTTPARHMTIQGKQAQDDN